MNLTITPRDKIVLGVFVVILVGVMWAYVRWATAPASGGRAIQPTATKELRRTTELSKVTKAEMTPVTDVAPAPFPAERVSPASMPRRDYRYIAERNIFQPPSESPTTTSEQSTSQKRSTRSQPSSGLSTPPPLPPAPPPPLPSQPTQLAARPANLTATGVFKIGDETYVLLENPQTRDVAIVKQGESAFGYEVTNVSEGYVEVRQGDIAYRMTLGEGKQERRVLAAVSPSGPRPPGEFGGPFGSAPGQFRSEQRGQQRRSSNEWVNRVVERWNQLPEFVRDRILQRVGEIWQQVPADQQQQILQRFREMGVNFTPPGR
ncbi:MAG: hypothetical protein ACUVTP_10120 [Candidatus Fervidibacter sp.]|uniref:hypothetical protein n=1 Tax=Candidatus Fervidibacter sp. TaxID=3100871 RepID=UPI00404B4D05